MSNFFNSSETKTPPRIKQSTVFIPSIANPGNENLTPEEIALNDASRQALQPKESALSSLPETLDRRKFPILSRIKNSAS